MVEFQQPCATGDCPQFLPEQQGSAAHINLCRSMVKMINGAGGTGFLEVSMCPVTAVFKDIATGMDPITLDVRRKLGIVEVGGND